MRRFSVYTQLLNQLLRADSQLIESLEQLRAALKLSFPNPHDQALQRESKLKLVNFSLALGLRDQIADALDELKQESKRVADSI